MHKQLPYRPNLEQLKKQARQLLKAQQAGDLPTCQRFQASLPRLHNVTVEEIRKSKVTLREAQHVIAREYGFASWKALSDIVKVSSADPSFGEMNGALSQTLWSMDLHRVIEKARLVSPDTTEFSTDDGEVILLEHGPLEGMRLRLTRPGDAQWVAMQVNAVSERPPWYPGALPFVANQTAWIARDGKNQFALWRIDQEEEPLSGSAAQRFEEHPSWEGIRERMEQLVSLIREGTAEGRKQFFDLIHESQPDQLWTSEMMHLAERMKQQFEDSSGRSEQFEEMVRNVIDQSVQDGWALVQEKGDRLVRYFRFSTHGSQRDLQIINTTKAKRIQLWDSVVRR